MKRTTGWVALAAVVLGTACSYGEDRFLTSLLLEHGGVRYQPKAVAETYAPDGIGALDRQRMRWSRSWFINSLLVSRFIWRRNVLASVVFYVIFISYIGIYVCLFVLAYL